MPILLLRTTLVAADDVSSRTGIEQVSRIDRVDEPAALMTGLTRAEYRGDSDLGVPPIGIAAADRQCDGRQEQQGESIRSGHR